MVVPSAIVTGRDIKPEPDWQPLPSYVPHWTYHEGHCNRKKTPRAQPFDVTASGKTAIDCHWIYQPLHANAHIRRMRKKTRDDFPQCSIFSLLIKQHSESQQISDVISCARGIKKYQINHSTLRRVLKHSDIQANCDVLTISKLSKNNRKINQNPETLTTPPHTHAHPHYTTTSFPHRFFACFRFLFLPTAIASFIRNRKKKQSNFIIIIIHKHNHISIFHRRKEKSKWMAKWGRKYRWGDKKAAAINVTAHHTVVVPKEAIEV